MFDDTFEHEVMNNTDKPRIILFLDVERPQSNITKPLVKAMIKFGGAATTNLKLKPRRRRARARRRRGASRSKGFRVGHWQIIRSIRGFEASKAADRYHASDERNFSTLCANLLRAHPTIWLRALSRVRRARRPVCGRLVAPVAGLPRAVPLGHSRLPL